MPGITVNDPWVSVLRRAAANIPASDLRRVGRPGLEPGTRGFPLESPGQFSSRPDWHSDLHGWAGQLDADSASLPVVSRRSGLPKGQPFLGPRRVTSSVSRASPTRPNVLLSLRRGCQRAWVCAQSCDPVDRHRIQPSTAASPSPGTRFPWGLLARLDSRWARSTAGGDTPSRVGGFARPRCNPGRGHRRRRSRRQCRRRRSAK